MYALLGGKTKARVPCYPTTSRPDLAQQMGFHGAKFPLPYGPEAGAEGLRQNVDFARIVPVCVPACGHSPPAGHTAHCAGLAR